MDNKNVERIAKKVVASITSTDSISGMEEYYFKFSLLVDYINKINEKLSKMSESLDNYDKEFIPFTSLIKNIRDLGMKNHISSSAIAEKYEALMKNMNSSYEAINSQNKNNIKKENDLQSKNSTIKENASNNSNPDLQKIYFGEVNKALDGSNVILSDSVNNINQFIGNDFHSVKGLISYINTVLKKIKSVDKIRSDNTDFNSNSQNTNQNYQQFGNALQNMNNQQLDQNIGDTEQSYGKAASKNSDDFDFEF